MKKSLKKNTRNHDKYRLALMQHAWRILVQQKQETGVDWKQARGEVMEKRKMISKQNDQFVPLGQHYWQ